MAIDQIDNIIVSSQHKKRDPKEQREMTLSENAFVKTKESVWSQIINEEGGAITNNMGLSKNNNC